MMNNKLSVVIFFLLLLLVISLTTLQLVATVNAEENNNNNSKSSSATTTTTTTSTKRITTTRRHRKLFKSTLIRLFKKYGIKIKNNNKSVVMVSQQDAQAIRSHLNRVEKRLRRLLKQMSRKYKEIRIRVKSLRRSLIEKKRTYRRARMIYKKYIEKSEKVITEQVTETSSDEENKTLREAETKLAQFKELLKNERLNFKRLKESWKKARELRKKHNAKIKAQFNVINQLRSLISHTASDN
nr:unnamed protein product [Naegleria fowleri]